VECNRTDQIIRVQVQKQALKRSNFSNLSLYNPGCLSKPRRISNQLAYNPDRIIQHTHHTLHFTSSSEIHLQHTESPLLQTMFIK
jgi:hypothetical protein